MFSRASVRTREEILREAYLHAIDNHKITMTMIEEAFNSDGRITVIDEGTQKLCTTKLVNAQERNMVQRARRGMNKMRPLNQSFIPSSMCQLNEQQLGAVQHVLKSPSRLTMIRGGAGTGKTTLMHEAKIQIEQVGKKMIVFAPTAEAANLTLPNEGFQGSQTIAKLLMDLELQESIRDQIIWVDEAGMLGAEDTDQLLAIAEAQSARLVFSGDPKQHTAIKRGDAMRVLSDVGRVPYASVKHIYRQKSLKYRESVDLIRQGKISEGFKYLDEIGAIKETNAKDNTSQLIKDYLEALKDKKSVLMISPTNEQRNQLVNGIRKALKAEKKLRDKDNYLTTYRNLHLTEAQKRDWRNYKPGQIIQTHKRIGTFRKEHFLKIEDVTDGKVCIRNQKGRLHNLPLNQADEFDVYLEAREGFCKGDLIRLTKNGRDHAGRRLNNGQVLEIKGFGVTGQIIGQVPGMEQNSTYIIDAHYGHLDHAYVLTSYSAQGKTVDQVLISQPSATFPASNQKQFYVSVSRAREKVTIYTDKKAELLDSIQRDGDRMSSLELTGFQPHLTMEADKDQSIELDKDHFNYE